MHAHHLMVEAVQADIVPASRLPKVDAAWEAPRHEEFRPQDGQSLFNAFMVIQKGSGPRRPLGGISAHLAGKQ